MVLQNQPQLVPQSFLPHPRSQNKVSLEHFVNCLEDEQFVTSICKFKIRHLLDWRRELPGLYLHDRDGGPTVDVREDQRASPTVPGIAANDRVPPEGDPTDHAGPEDEGVPPRHPRADPCQLRPQGRQHPEDLLLLALNIIQTPGNVLVLVLFVLKLLSILAES